jgi:hypothetical protein
MDCKLDKNLLYAYADKTIDPLEKIFVEEHLKYCDACKKDLDVIYLIDENLNNIQEDLILPERLSMISKLVVENCLAQTDQEDFKSKVENLYSSYKEINKTIKDSQNLYKLNPFNKFIYKSVNKSIDYMKKPVKKYVKKKVAKISLFNLFNAG